MPLETTARVLVELADTLWTLSVQNHPPQLHGADTLRGEWGFEGYVVSDCDTIGAIATSFHYTASVEQATAMAVKAGGDLNCGPEYSQLINATAHGFITEAELDVSVRRLMRRRIQIGDLDAKG